MEQGVGLQPNRQRKGTLIGDPCVLENECLERHVFLYATLEWPQYLDGDRHRVHGLVADLEAPDMQDPHTGDVLLDQDGQTENEVLCLGAL